MVLGLVNDRVGMWMEHVLQRGSFQGGEGTRAEVGVGEE